MPSLLRMYEISIHPVTLNRIYMAFSVVAREPLQTKPTTIEEAKVYRLCWDFRFKKNIADTASLVSTMIIQAEAMAPFVDSITRDDLEPQTEAAMDAVLTAVISGILPTYAHAVITDSLAQQTLAGRMN